MTKYNKITPTSLHPHPTFLRVPKLLLDPSVSRRRSFLNHVESHWLSQVLQRPGTQKFLPFEEQFKSCIFFSSNLREIQRQSIRSKCLNLLLDFFTEGHYWRGNLGSSTVSRHNPLFEGRFQLIAEACEGSHGWSSILSMWPVKTVATASLNNFRCSSLMTCCHPQGYDAIENFWSFLKVLGL